MPGPVLATKLYKPPARPNAVPRPALVARLDESRGRALIIVSAPAGFGKSSLLSAWIDERARREAKLRAAWLSLDEADSDPSRFLLYVAAALHGADASIGADAMAALLSPQQVSTTEILTDLVNEIDGCSVDVLLVLDDYHAVRSAEVDGQLAFLLEHRPSRLQIAVATREDPVLPLARLRARGELTELRAADLRFSLDEAAQFLAEVMGLELTVENVQALESRTEGWIAGLQLAALSLRGQQDVGGFIRSFGGSHRFVLDYVGAEVLRSLPADIQAFLLRTSILERFCGPLCDALVPGASGQQSMEYLDRANLFVVPLDAERMWYRYHRLFAELLRQRLESGPGGQATARELHVRASEWFEASGLLLEAFHHAAAAGDLDRAERLVSGRSMPLQSRDAVVPVLDWIASLPAPVLDARPSLRVTFASLSLFTGRVARVEEMLTAAERSLEKEEQDEAVRDLAGRIAAARATVAITRYQADVIMVQAKRALELLRADSVLFRLRALWTVAFGHILQGSRAAARASYQELERAAQASGVAVYVPLSQLGLGDCQLADNELPQAAETYRQALRAFGEHPQPIASEIHHGLGRVLYEWNDLDPAEEHAERGLQLARRYGPEMDRFILPEILLARIALARGQVAAAAARLDALALTARAPSYCHRLPEIAAAQVPVLLRQGRLEEAARLAASFNVLVSRARVLLAQDDASEALAALTPLRERAEAAGHKDELLRAEVLQAVALQAAGREQEAADVLLRALPAAEAGGFVRLFLDEGSPMAGLLAAARARGASPAYVDKLLAALTAESRADGEPGPTGPAASALVEPLSEREQEVLRLVAEGLSNQEIGDRLFLALDTIKGHNRRIFEKLGVRRRTEAIARGRELGLL
jgi:LuxR family maltose regulon positive regulatory protein